MMQTVRQHNDMTMARTMAAQLITTIDALLASNSFGADELDAMETALLGAQAIAGRVETVWKSLT